MKLGAALADAFAADLQRQRHELAWDICGDYGASAFHAYTAHLWWGWRWPVASQLRSKTGAPSHAWTMTHDDRGRRVSYGDGVRAPADLSSLCGACGAVLVGEIELRTMAGASRWIGPPWRCPAGCV